MPLLESRNPDGLFDFSETSSHIMVPGKGARPVFISGQWAFDESGDLASVAFGGQVDTTFRNVAVVLDSLGIGREHVAKLSHHVVDLDEERSLILAERVAAIWPDRRPAATVVGVAALSRAGMLYQVDISAVLPD